jgi:hypothetical protein
LRFDLSAIIFFFLANKASLNKRKAEAGRKVHTTSMLWKVPKELVIFERQPDTLAVLKSTVMQANKIKVEHGVVSLPLPVVGQIPLLLNQ